MVYKVFYTGKVGFVVGFVIIIYTTPWFLVWCVSCGVWWFVVFGFLCGGLVVVGGCCWWGFENNILITMRKIVVEGCKIVVEISFLLEIMVVSSGNRGLYFVHW